MKVFSRVLLAACIMAFTSAAMAQEPDPQIVSLYKTKCAACHGADGKGDTAAGKKLAARDFSLPEIMKAPDAELFEITLKGKNKMPGFDKKLTEVQIKSLVGYIRGLTKAKK
jgi:cytochrome c6